MEELLSQAERFENINDKLGRAIAQAKAHLQQIERTLDDRVENANNEQFGTVVVRKSLVLKANRYLN